MKFIFCCWINTVLANQTTSVSSLVPLGCDVLLFLQSQSCKALLYNEWLEAESCLLSVSMSNNHKQNHLYHKFVLGEYGTLGCWVHICIPDFVIEFIHGIFPTPTVNTGDTVMTTMKGMRLLKGWMSHLMVSHPKEILVASTLSIGWSYKVQILRNFAIYIRYFFK